MTKVYVKTDPNVSVKTEKLDPDAYRLCRKKSGEIVLQGAYMWQTAFEYGYEWRDIETVDEE